MIGLSGRNFMNRQGNIPVCRDMFRVRSRSADRGLDWVVSIWFRDKQTWLLYAKLLWSYHEFYFARFSLRFRDDLSLQFREDFSLNLGGWRSLIPHRRWCILNIVYLTPARRLLRRLLLSLYCRYYHQLGIVSTNFSSISFSSLHLFLSFVYALNNTRYSWVL